MRHDCLDESCKARHSILSSPNVVTVITSKWRIFPFNGISVFLSCCIPAMTYLTILFIHQHTFRSISSSVERFKIPKPGALWPGTLRNFSADPHDVCNERSHFATG